MILRNIQKQTSMAANGLFQQVACVSLKSIQGMQKRVARDLLQLISVTVTMNHSHKELLWVDLEMSGLDPTKNRILEFACILSDKKLQHLEEGPHIIIQCDEPHLKQMDEWNTSHHTKSGLYQACLNSKVRLHEAEQQILQYLESKGVMKGQLCLAGNSIHHDKVFIMHYMPRLHDFLHYQILDVSSIKMVVNALNPSLFYKKKNAHQALEDIRESIGELQFYLKHAFKG